jgi:hypothetical protein
MARNSNNPPQAQLQSLPGNLARKTGPGTRRVVGDTTGPAYAVPRINPNTQSNRANEVKRNISPGTSEIIDRASVQLPSAYRGAPAPV